MLSGARTSQQRTTEADLIEVLYCMGILCILLPRDDPPFTFVALPFPLSVLSSVKNSCGLRFQTGSMCLVGWEDWSCCQTCNFISILLTPTFHIPHSTFRSLNLSTLCHSDLAERAVACRFPICVAGKSALVFDKRHPTTVVYSE